MGIYRWIVSWLYYNERVDFLYKFMNNVFYKDRRLIILEEFFFEFEIISNYNNEILIINLLGVNFIICYNEFFVFNFGGELNEILLKVVIEECVLYWGLN